MPHLRPAALGRLIAAHIGGQNTDDRFDCEMPAGETMGQAAKTAVVIEWSGSSRPLDGEGVLLADHVVLPPCGRPGNQRSPPGLWG